MKKIVLFMYLCLALYSCKSKTCVKSEIEAFTHYQINQGLYNSGDSGFMFNIYDKPNGAIIFNLPSDEESGWEVVILEIENNYFKIRNTWSQAYVKEQVGPWANIWKNDWMSEYKEVWIEKGSVGLNTQNYDGQIINLYQKPDSSSEVVGKLNKVQTVVVWDGCEDWAYVEAMDRNGVTLKGWLSPKDQCPNPLTTCP